jgi:hypothetical protein
VGLELEVGVQYKKRSTEIPTFVGARGRPWNLVKAEIQVPRHVTAINGLDETLILTDTHYFQALIPRLALLTDLSGHVILSVVLARA